MTTTNELQLLCNDNDLTDNDRLAVLACAQKFGVPIVAAYRRAKELALLSYQQTEALKEAGPLSTLKPEGAQISGACHCTLVAQDESCPVGYPSLLCDDCDGKGHVHVKHVKLDGPELWEIVFGIATEAAHEITDDQYSRIAEAINTVFIDTALSTVKTPAEPLVTKEWLEQKATMEDGHEIGVGRSLFHSVGELEKLAFDALPEWARKELTACRAREQISGKATPFIFISEQQIAGMGDCHYIAYRKIAEGNFQFPLYSHPSSEQISGEAVERGWQPIETAPKDCDLLAFGSYLYHDDTHPTTYMMVAEVCDDKRWPYITDEGRHPPEFFSHWMPLPNPPEQKP